MKFAHYRQLVVLIALACASFFVQPELALAESAASGSAATKTKIRVETDAQSGGWSIFSGDDLFATYIPDSNGKPIVYPIAGPSGHPMTRNFPMKQDVKEERSDHDHHRSLWLTHGEVNGIDFWLDDEEKGCGKIVQISGSATVDPDTGAAVITTENEWRGPDGKRVLSDKRRFAFFEEGGRRIIDCDTLLMATDGDVNFGDTKEGSFGMRVGGTMKVDAKLGGIITNAEGLNNKDAWGKKSAWVDYSGPVNGDTVGITIHGHPSGFGFPCRWHVRTYGLFAANPFGVHHFTGGTQTSGIVLKEGNRMRLNYRVVLHDGPLDAEQAAEDSEQYANDPRPEME
tara:strand:+ start:392747 stop:393772 length:1026 start_codon:yes stop_codon:yes gene_type:complete